jgi:hypothetical protein
MLKFCNSCQQEKQIDCFSFKSKAKGTRNSKCKICHRIDQKKHYQKNTEYYIQKASEKKKQTREWWQEYKKQFKCPCGESHPACIEFHHHEKNKEDDVSYMMNNGSRKKGLEEIKKCIPICSNCHRKLHYELREKKIDMT